MINQNASYLLAHKGQYLKEPIVKMADPVQAMRQEFDRQGWDVKVSSGGANWLFYGANDRRMRLKNKLYLEGSTDYYGSRRWFTIRSYKLKKDFNPAIVARFIAKLLGSYNPPLPLANLDSSGE